ncbi:MAG: hypothetical protein Q9163_000860 [Psora crenata]
MDPLARDYHHALQTYNGHLLAATISPIAPPHYLNRLDAIFHASNSATVQRDISYALTKHAHRSITKEDRQNLDNWTEIYVAYWHAAGAILAAQSPDTVKPDWAKVYETWKDVANAVIKGYSNSSLETWTLPVLYLAGKYLRVFAITADKINKALDGQAGFITHGLQDDIIGDHRKNERLEDAARLINRMFTLCISDRYVARQPVTSSRLTCCAEGKFCRAPLEDSRKWGLYYITNLLFKTYFKLNSIGLSKNILRAISASKTDMPDLELFPKSHIVTFKYYVGVIQFLEEDYAEENLTSALAFCHRNARRNKELILTYLIPTRLLTSQRLPSLDLLLPYPRLAALFTPLAAAIRSGSLSSFDRALAAGEASFVKGRIYLTLERGRDICLRNLLRKVYLAAGTDDQGNKRTRIKVEEFGLAIRLGEAQVGVNETNKMAGGRYLEGDEVECLLANMIYKNLMKGYISRAAGTVVLSKTGAFPGTDISTNNIVFRTSYLSKASKEELFEWTGPLRTDEVVRLDGKPLEDSLPKQLVEPASWAGWGWAEYDEDIRIIDFGEAFLQGEEPETLAQPRCLRAPETIFTNSFDYRLDLWRAGIVVWELPL